MNRSRRLQSRKSEAKESAEERDSFLESTGKFISASGKQEDRAEQPFVRKEQATTGNQQQQQEGPHYLGESSRLIGESTCEISDSGCCLPRFCCCFKPDKRSHQQQPVGSCLASDSSSQLRASGSTKRQRMTKTSSLLAAYFVAELIGTFLLVVIGDGTIGTYVLNKREVDIFTACFAFGVGVMIATFASGKISGAHVNPAASVAFALDGRLKWCLVPVYLSAQYLGGFLAALMLFANNQEAINSLDGGHHSAFGQNNSTGHIFATYPGPWLSSPWAALLDQVFGTAVLLFSQCAVTDRNNLGLEERHQPLILALVVGLICVAFNANCGAIFNPARDLAPRLLTLLVGYPNAFSPTQGYYWLAAGLMGPHLGAIVGVFAYKLLVGAALTTKRQFELDSFSLEQKQQRSGQQQLAKLTGHHHAQQQQQQQTGTNTQQQPAPMLRNTQQLRNTDSGSPSYNSPAAALFNH